MSKLTKDEVLKLAKLARLQLTEVEVNKYAHELGEILEYVELLSSVDTSGLEPTNQVTGLHSVYRKDEVKAYQSKPEDLLALAPESQSGYIKVKRMI
jgi:aspartyl-tRNA(Asn)/glutamyl-tRNA(Gln) amidotransferase subunit C